MYNVQGTSDDEGNVIFAQDNKSLPTDKNNNTEHCSVHSLPSNTHDV